MESSAIADALVSDGRSYRARFYLAVDVPPRQRRSRNLTVCACANLRHRTPVTRTRNHTPPLIPVPPRRTPPTESARRTLPTASAFVAELPALPPGSQLRASAARTCRAAGHVDRGARRKCQFSGKASAIPKQRSQRKTVGSSDLFRGLRASRLRKTSRLSGLCVRRVSLLQGDAAANSVAIACADRT